MKRFNKMMLRKALLKLGDATRKELMSATGISSSSISTLITEMLQDNDILEKSADFSSGGRCPMRYILNHRKYRVLCAVQHGEAIEIFVYDSLFHTIYNEQGKKLNDAWPQHIMDICGKFHVKAIYLSTSADEQGLCLRACLAPLCASLDVPVVFEKDVNCMIQGYLYEYAQVQESILYLYLSDTGSLSCASMSHGRLLQGHDGLAGAIGFLQYHGRSINTVLQESCDPILMMEIMAHLLAMLISIINPSLIVLAGLSMLSIPALSEQVKALVPSCFTVCFTKDEQPYGHIVKSLWYQAMMAGMADLDEKKQKNN